MDQSRPRVVIGFIGSKLDAATGRDRWDTWRPTVDLCRHEDRVVHRLELLLEPRHDALTRQVVADIASVSPETEVRLHPVPLEDAWDFENVFTTLLDFARDYPFDPENEDYLVHITTGSHVGQICLFLLTESRHFPARLLQTAPPVRADGGQPRWREIDLDLSRYDLLARRFERESTEARSFLKGGIETRDPVFNALIERIEQVALATPAPILLTGATGTGKSQLARRIYQLKADRHATKGPFVEVNCATLHGDAAMSALFGHKRGAYTGATSDRAGLLKAAHEGVLFLDEIGELGLDEQAMLLHAIEEQRFRPLGSDRLETSRFQLIAGTNRDLPTRVREGRFREDLLARIDLWAFRLPGLSERHEDLEPNLQHELERFERHTGRRATINREARMRFVEFAKSPRALWSANFRDLNAAVTRMATLAPGARITTREVDDEVARLRQAWGAAAPDAGPPEHTLGAPETEHLDRFDRVQLEDVLAVCRMAPSLSEAGRVLFAQSRRRRTSTNDADRLRKYLARFGWSWERVRGSR